MEIYSHRNDNTNFSSVIIKHGQYLFEFDVFRNAIVFTILGVFSLITVFGNSMVILVVLCRQNLQSPTGYMILSLAVADLIVGLIVMPFNIIHEVLQHQWRFGLGVCDFWHSVDVLASTASIWNLCLLAIDRYIAVNDPLNYRQRITLRKALFFIGLVWFVSCIISFPAIVWWRYTAVQLYVNDSICEFTDDLGYLVFSSLVSFYVPLFIIVYAYWRVYTVASAFQRQLVTGQHPSAFSPGVHMRVHRGGTPGNGRKFKTMGNQQQTIVNVSMLLVTTGADDSSVSSSQLDNISSVTVSSALVLPNRKAATTTSPVIPDEKSPLRDRNATPPPKTPPSPLRSFRRRVCMQRYASTNTMCSRRLQLQQQQSVAPPTHRLTFREEESMDGASNMLQKSAGRLSKIRAKLLLKESKAAKTLGIVVTCFITCWLPFFVINVLLGVCKTCIPDERNRMIIFTTVTWLGYCNSAINPFIYSLFNKEFGQAFKWLLLCKLCRRHRKESSGEKRSITFTRSVAVAQGVVRVVPSSVALVASSDQRIDFTLDDKERSLETMCKHRYGT